MKSALRESKCPLAMLWRSSVYRHDLILSLRLVVTRTCCCSRLPPLWISFDLSVNIGILQEIGDVPQDLSIGCPVL